MMMDRKIEIPLVSTFVPPQLSLIISANTESLKSIFCLSPVLISSHVHNWITRNLQKEVFSSLNFESCNYSVIKEIAI